MPDFLLSLNHSPIYVRLALVLGNVKIGRSLHCALLCREVLWEEGEDGRPVVTGLRMSTGGVEEVVKRDAYVAALDVPGAKRMIPEEWRRFPLFDNIHQLVGVKVITVQLR